MERLTERSKSKNSSMVWFKDENNNMLLEPCEMSSHHSRMAIAKLAAYEDDEEQGLLLRLPCKVGDTVYIIIAKSISKQKVKEIIIDGYGIKFKTKRRIFGLCDVFYTVFLTKEEAKAKLKKMDIKYISKKDLMMLWIYLKVMNYYLCLKKNCLILKLRKLCLKKNCLILKLRKLRKLKV